MHNKNRSQFLETNSRDNIKFLDAWYVFFTYRRKGISRLTFVLIHLIKYNVIELCSYKVK